MYSPKMLYVFRSRSKKMTGVFYQVLAGVLGFACTSLITLFASHIRKAKGKADKVNRDFELMKSGMMYLLKAQLKADYEYYNKQGFCSVEDKEDYSNLYHTYHELGGNGLGTNLYDLVMSMPTIQSEK